MKTTLDLPDDLVRRIKIRAVEERRPLKNLVAHLLAQALDGSCGLPSRDAPPPEDLTLTEDGFPILPCRGGAPAPRISAGELAALERAILEEEELTRAGLPS